MRIVWGGLCNERPKLLEVADRIDAWLHNGKTGDVLNISMPTRFGKSLLATAASVWMLVCDPSVRLLRASYSADLAETFSQQVRNQYTAFCDKIELNSSTKGTRGRWSIGERDEPNHAGVGIGGGITGFGFDIAIVDDTAKNMLEATSAAYSRQLKVFKESVLLGRLEGRRKILNVGTRWTVNDWFSMWPDAESYVLPAMIDDKSCCEAWKTTAELELERSRVSDSVWNAQYMQAPTETGRVRLFEGWHPLRVTADEIPSDAPHVIVIDPTTDYGKDFFVMGDYMFHGGMMYLYDMFAEQAASPERAAEWLKGRNYKVAWIECNGVGSSVMDKMRKAGCRNMAGFSTNSDKYSRAYVQAEAIKNYTRIVEGCNPKAVAELVREADVFPIEGDEIHDDLLDNLVMAYERIYRI
jgi:Uncharacterized protein conserved in bacteria